MAANDGLQPPLLENQPPPAIGEADQKKIQWRLMIAIFVATMLIPTSFQVYAFHTNRGGSHTMLQEVFFLCFTVAASASFVLIVGSLVFFYLISSPSRFSTPSLSWASMFTLVSLLMMGTSFVFACLTALDGRHAMVVFSAILFSVTCYLGIYYARRFYF